MERDQTSDGDFEAMVKSITSQLRADGPPVDFELVVGFIDKTLAPSAMQQIGVYIVTFRNWYDSYWETVATLDSSILENV